MIILRVTNDDKVVTDLIPLDDVDLRLDISAIENTEIGSTFGISSQEFAIAGDNKSNQFFGNLYNLGATPAVALKNSVKCQVLNDGQEVFSGKLYIRNIITDQKGYTIYNIIVVNETIDFKYRIQNLALNDPKFDFSAYDHAFTAANVTGSWSNGLFSGSVIYPNIHYGNDGNPDTPNYAFAGLSQAARLENTIDNAASPLRLQDFKPAIKLRDVVDVIFSGSFTSGSVGYEYTSSFFEGAYFNELYLLTTANDQLGPANNSPISQSAWVFSTGSQTLADGVIANIDFNAKAYDNSNNFNLTTDRYTGDIAGSYTFTGQIKFNITNWSLEPTQKVTVRFVKNNLNIINTLTSFNIYPTNNSFFFQETINLDAGDFIEVEVVFQDPSIGVKSIVITPGRLNTFLQVRGPASVAGGTVRINQQFPDDLKALDLIQALIEKFNLVVEPVPNNSNLLSIEPYDTWFDSGEIINWTNKVDRDVNFEISSPVIEQPRTINFSDIDDEDYLNKYTKEVFNKTYGQFIFTSDSDLAEGERRIGKVFAPTPTTNIPNSSAFIIPHLCTRPVNSDSIYKPMAFKPRILYGIGLQDVESSAGGFTGGVPSGTGSYFLRDEFGNVTQQSNWYQVSSLTETPISGAAFDLHFNNNDLSAGAIPPYWSNVSPNNFISGSGDVFTTYWANYINGLYDIDARKLVCNIDLDPSEISSIRLNQKFFIDGAYYRINRINGANLTRRDTVEVEFIKTIARKLTFPRRRVIGTIDGITRDVQFQGRDTNGGGIYEDFETGERIFDFDIIAQAGPLDGVKVFKEGVGGATGSVVWNFLEPLVPVIAQTSLGTNNVSADSSKVFTVGSNNFVGRSVSTVTAIGQANTIQQNVTNAFVVGQQNTIGETIVNAQIVGGSGNTISGSNSVNMAIFSSTGSTVFNSDFSTMINGLDATILDSDHTVAINSHQNEVIINGSGHTVIGFNREGAGLDLLSTRNNSNFLGDTYIGGGLLRDSFTINVGDGTNYFLTGSNYGGGKHESLYLLNWNGLSPGTASINLPSAANPNYRGSQYTFKANGTFDGTTYLEVIPFDLAQSIDGQTSIAFSSSFSVLTIFSTGSNWFTLSGAGGVSGTGALIPSLEQVTTVGSSSSHTILLDGGAIAQTFEVTGSLVGNYEKKNTSALHVLDCATSNFFDITLPSASSCHIAASNQRPGQTVNVIVNTGNNPTGSVTFSDAFKQPSGSVYIPTQATGAIDALSCVGGLSGSTPILYLVSANNFVTTPGAPISASGGQEITISGFRYHIFTGSLDTFTMFTEAPVQVLVVGPGGDGNSGSLGTAGGGGGGGVLFNSSYTVPTGSYSMSVPSRFSSSIAYSGSAFELIAIRGGNGGTSAIAATTGSSGGGGSIAFPTGALGTIGQGFSGSNVDGAGGAGGGAGGLGTNRGGDSSIGGPGLFVSEFAPLNSVFAPQTASTSYPNLFFGGYPDGYYGGGGGANNIAGTAVGEGDFGGGARNHGPSGSFDLGGVKRNSDGVPFVGGGAMGGVVSSGRGLNRGGSGAIYIRYPIS